MCMIPSQCAVEELQAHVMGDNTQDETVKKKHKISPHSGDASVSHRGPRWNLRERKQWPAGGARTREDHQLWGFILCVPYISQQSIEQLLRYFILTKVVPTLMSNAFYGDLVWLQMYHNWPKLTNVYLWLDSIEKICILPFLFFMVNSAKSFSLTHSSFEV